MDVMQPPGRSVDDPSTVRKAIFDSSLAAVQGLQPIANAQHSLEISDAAYEGPESFTRAQQKQATLYGNSLGRKLRGTVTLRDVVTGQPLAQKRTTLASIPYYTDDGTFIDKGSAYTLASQLRMKPGVYHRQKGDGSLEAHVNTLPGQGVPHRLFLDPKTGIFRVRIAQANMPLVPMLQAMGVRDEQLKQAWGNDLAAVNLQKSTSADMAKLYRKLVRNGTSDNPVEQQAAIAEAMQKTVLDPDVSQQTLGKPFDRVSAEAVLASTRKLLGMQNRDNPDLLQRLGLKSEKEDDRDHLAYMNLHGPEDMFAERLRAASRQLRQSLWKSGRNKNLDSIGAGIFDRDVRGVLLDSGLGQASESINPIQVFEQQMRVSRLGRGAIGSTDAIPESARGVQPSYFGAIDPVATPESSAAGVDVRMVRQLRKGPNGEIYLPFSDVRSGEQVWKQPKELQNAVIAFPGEERSAIHAANGKTYVRAMKAGKIDYVPSETVDYQLPHMEQAFNPTTNLVPFKSAMKGQRVSMAARMITQALPLEGGEAPLTQNAVPDQEDQSYDELYGERMGAVKARKAGHVLSVTPEEIQVRYADGTQGTIELTQHAASNRKTYMHQEPVVQAGQVIGPGTLLAKSNYTDASGAGSMGLNVRVGYNSARGKNYEDAIVVSQSLADRMKSLHMYQHKREFDRDRDVVNKGRFAGIFPGKFNKSQLEAMDDDGVVRVGQQVEYGDPLVLVANQRQGRVGEVSRASAHAFRDQSETWSHHSTGIVTDVAKTPKGVLVAVKTAVPMQEGDKVSGRFGNKGVVNVVPDDQMPVAEDGKPLEVLFNSLGVISRSNPAQVAEVLLGKIAAATGKPYKVKDFGEIDDLTAYAQQELQRHGLKDTETLTDPETGRKIPGVLVGNSFLMKLHHLAESKGSGRSFGSYTSDEQPGKGGDSGSKTWGMLHLNALLSHGATASVADAHRVRGQRNHDYWAAVMAGKTPPDPPVPMVYQKFVNQLQAVGINPVRTGTRTQLMAMTDDDINRLTADRTLRNNRTVEWKDESLTPIAGGLFDQALHGGAAGNLWSKIPLSEPMLNPVMEVPTRKLLGLTEDNFRQVLAGRQPLNGETGPQAIAKALGKIDVDRDIQQAKLTIRNGRATARNEAVRKLGFLLGIQKTGVKPSQWMWNSVPVLPPKFRAVSRMSGTDAPMVADANFLYRDLFDAHENLKWARDNLEDSSDERLATYDALKAVTGLGDPAPVKLQQQQVKGILKHILGSGPKNSIVQRKLLGTTTDLVMRGTALPNPDLDMDEIAIPEEQAWKAYQPFIVRHLVKRGMGPGRAAIAVAGKQGPAREALLAVMQERPVYMDRSPVLHRYSVMSFWPRLTKGHNIEVNALITKGMGMDFDGDALQVHVPASAGAVADAKEKMLPSQNLFSVSEFKPHYMPQQEYLGGLYAASTAKSDKPPVTFKTRREAIRAYQRGEFDLGQAIDILDEKG